MFQSIFNRYHDEIKFLYQILLSTNSQTSRLLSNRTRKSMTRLFYAVCAIQSIRFLCVGISLQLDFEQYFRLDITMAELNRGNQFDGIVFALGSLIYLQSSYMHHNLYEWRPTWSVYIHDLVVRNRENYFQLNPFLKINWKQFKRSPVQEVVLRIRNNAQTSTGSVGKVRLHHVRLWFHGALSHKLRVQTIYRTLALDLFNTIYLALYLVGCPVILLIYYNLRLSANYPNWIISLIYLDFISVTYLVFRLSVDILYLIYSIYILSFVYTRFLRNLSRKLSLLFRKHKNFARIFYEHTKLVRTVWKMNQRISPAICTSFLVNFAYNVYLVTSLFFKENLLLTNRFVISFFIYVQLCCIVSSSLSMIRITEAIHCIDKTIITSNSIGFSRNAGKKLKLMTFYEFAHSVERKITFTVGPIGKVTREALFQVNST